MGAAMKKWTFCLIFVFILGHFCSLARADVNVSAAISLKAVLEKAQPELEKAAGEKIVFNFGASGTLALQIQQESACATCSSPPIVPPCKNICRPTPAVFWKKEPITPSRAISSF